MNVLVAGAGYVGGALAIELCAAGHRVWALRRKPEQLGPGVVTMAADLASGGAALALPQAIDSIVYCVAPDGSSDAEYERAYVTGLDALLRAAERQELALRRVVFTSSTAVYAQDDGGIVDEASEVTAAGTARFLLAAEALVRALGAHRGVVVRLAGIYGPGRDRMVRSVKDGTARITTPSPIGNRIHQADCVGALAHVLSLAEPAPVYVGVDDAPAPLDEVYRWLARELGVAEPTLGVADARGRASTRKRCSNRLLRASGYALRFPTYREGYAALLAALGAPS